ARSSPIWCRERHPRWTSRHSRRAPTPSTDPPLLSPADQHRVFAKESIRVSDLDAPFLDPRTTALVLIDLQNSQHRSAPYSPQEIVDRAVRRADAPGAGGGLVVFVRTSWLPDDSDRLHQRIDAARPPARPRPEGWDQLVPQLRPLPTEPVVTK